MGVHDMGRPLNTGEKEPDWRQIAMNKNPLIIGRARQSFEDMAKERMLDPEEIRPVYERLLDRLVEERSRQKVGVVKFEGAGE